MAMEPVERRRHYDKKQREALASMQVNGVCELILRGDGEAGAWSQFGAVES